MSAMMAPPVVACLVAAAVLLSLLSGCGSSSVVHGQLRKISHCFRALPHSDAGAVIRHCAKHGLR